MNRPQYQIIVLPTAFEDMDSILNHIKRDSPQNAVNMIDRLWKAVQSLTTLPHRHKIYRWNKYSDRLIRSMLVTPFAIYYRVIESPPQVRILTVRHGARRQPKRFREQ